MRAGPERGSISGVRQGLPHRCLFGLTDAQIHREGGQGCPFLSLAMLQVEALRGAVGARPPVGVRCRWGAFDADRFDAGFADIPGFAAVVGLEELVSVAARAPAMIDHQRAALPILEIELLDGSETGLIEDLMGTPGLAAVGSHQQEWVLWKRGE